MKTKRNLIKAFGKDEFGFTNYPVKYSNTRISRLLYGNLMGCSYCFPHGFETINSRYEKPQRNWKEFRDKQWKYNLKRKGMPTLKRISDGSGDSGEISQAMIFNEDGTLKEIISNRPKLGCSMLVGTKQPRPFGAQEYWQTTEITEIIEEREDYVKFRTGNSIYEWWA